MTCCCFKTIQSSGTCENQTPLWTYRKFNVILGFVEIMHVIFMTNNICRMSRRNASRENSDIGL